MLPVWIIEDETNKRTGWKEKRYLRAESSAENSICVSDVVGAAEEKRRRCHGLRRPPNVTRPTRAALESVRDVIEADGDHLNRAIDR